MALLTLDVKSVTDEKCLTFEDEIYTPWDPLTVCIFR